jgi:hypothetical protein
MGKQLSIYLDETEFRQLTAIAIRECRRPNDQARYILLKALGLVDGNDEPTAPTKSKTACVPQDSGGFAGTNS